MAPRRRSDTVAPISSCDCRDCRAACTNSPGWFRPGEVELLARHLGLSVTETFTKYLAVSVTKMPDGTSVHGVMPHKLRDGKKPGSVWSLAELAEPGRCVFFDRGRCSIYAVRPFECARMIHGLADRAVRLRHVIVREWTRQDLAPFAKLTGKQLFGSAPRPTRGGRGPARRS